MSSLYPTGLDAFSTAHADGVNEVVHAATINDLADAVNKIEGELGVNPRSALSHADYVIYKTPGGSTYQAKGRGSLADVAANADAGSVLQSCLDNINGSTTPRGTVFFAPNTTFTFTGGTTPKIRRTYASGGSDDGRWIRILGSGGSVIQFTSATSAGQQFLNFNKVADYDGFCGVEIGFLEFDGNNLFASSDSIIGVQTDAGVSALLRCDFRRIWIHDCSAYNLTCGTVANAKQRCFVWIQASHASAGEGTQTQITDITVERCRVRGGNLGVAVMGTVGSGGLAGLNIYGDRIRVSDLDWDSGQASNPALSAGSSGIQIGSGMFGDRMIIERCKIVGSSDDGIETNNFRYINVRDCYIKGCVNAMYVNAQFNFVNGVDNTSATDQIILYERCVGQIAYSGMPTTITNQMFNLFGTGTAGCDQGTIKIKDCRTSCGSTSLAQGQLPGSSVAFSVFNVNCERVIFEGCTFDAFYNDTATSVTSTPFFASQLPRNLVIRDCDFTVRGAQTGGSYAVYVMRLDGKTNGGGTARVDVDGLTISDLTTGRVNFNTSLIYIGASAANPGDQSVVLRRVRLLQTPAININAIEVGNSTTLTLRKLAIEDCDFSAMTASSRVVLFDTVGQNDGAVSYEGVSTEGLADYVIYKTPGASTFQAVGKTFVAPNADAAAILQTCLTNIASTGGTIAFAPATTYTWSSVPLIPRNFANGGSANQQWIRILGNGAKISLGAGVRQFLGFNRVADYDTFQYVEIGGFIVDCTNWPATAGALQSVIGTANNTVQTLQRVNFDTIWIHDIKGINIPTQKGGATNNANAGIWIEVSQAAVAEATNNYIRNILIERCRFEGGDTGILVGAVNSAGGNTPGLRVYADNWVARDCWHSTNVTPTATFVGSNFQFGGLIASTLSGGPSTLVCERLYGYGSGDDGLETNGFESINVTDCVMEDSWNLGFYVTNFNYLNGVDATSDARQHVTYTRCKHRVSNNLGPNQNYGWILQPVHDIGTLSLVDCSYEVKSIVMGATLPIKLAIFHSSSQPGIIHTINIDRFKAVYDSVTNATATDNDLQCFLFNGPGPCNLNVRDSGIIAAGSRTSTGQIFLKPFKMYGQDYRVNIDGFSIEDNITGRVADTTRSIEVGEAQWSAGVNSKIRGRIARLKWVNTGSVDNSPRGVWVYASTTGTISEKLVCEHFDFSGMASVSNEVFVADTTNSAKVFARHISWGSGAQKAPQTLTVAATTVAQQYTGLYPGLAFIIGGTVSLVEVSPDGTNFNTISAATNCSFWLENGWSYRLTYTVAPTAKIFWQP